MIRSAFALICLMTGAPVWALDLDLPGSARLVSERSQQADYALPTGPWSAGRIETIQIPGTVQRRTWRIEDASTIGQILQPLLDQIRVAGFDPIFDCVTNACGGFDFRFAIDVVPAPDMFVDLSDFQFVSAISPSGDGLSLLVSGGRSGSWLQMIEVTRAAPHTPQDLAQALVDTGRLVLGPEDDAALEVLARFLDEHQDLHLAIVAHSGHRNDDDATRAAGLSDAQSMRARLIAEFGASPDKIEAIWLGPYAPRTSPLTATGQDINQRIEAVILSD